MARGGSGSGSGSGRGVVCGGSGGVVMLALQIWALTCNFHPRVLGSQDMIILLSRLVHSVNYAEKAQFKVLVTLMDRLVESIQALEPTAWQKTDCYLYAVCLMAGLVMHSIKLRWPYESMHDEDHTVASAQRSLQRCLADEARCHPVLGEVFKALTQGIAAVEALGRAKGLCYEDRGVVLIGDGSQPPRDTLVINTGGWIRCVSGTRIDCRGEWDPDEAKQLGNIQAPVEEESVVLPNSKVHEYVWFVANQAE